MIVLEFPIQFKVYSFFSNLDNDQRHTAHVYKHSAYIHTFRVLTVSCSTSNLQYETQGVLGPQGMLAQLEHEGCLDHTSFRKLSVMVIPVSSKPR